jgi:hypothetical protein
MDHYSFLLLSMSLQEAKALLGFAPNESPSDSEVRKALRDKVMKVHPDQGGSSEKMVELNVAQDVLLGKQRPTYDRSDAPSSPSPQPQTRWEPPKKEEVSFDEAKSKAGIPSGVEWQFVTSAQRGVGYSSDEFHRSDIAWVVYGKTEHAHVFVGVRHFVKEEYFVGGAGGKDLWSMKSLDFPIKGEEGLEPAWLFGNVVKVLKLVGSEARFNSKVTDAKGWTFSDKFPRGGETSIKHWLASSGAVSEDDARVQGRKHVIEVKYTRGWNEAPNHYKIVYGKPPYEFSSDFEGVEVIVNGKAHWLDEKDTSKFLRSGFKRAIFGDRLYDGTKKNLTRSKDGKKFLTEMAKHLSSLPADVQKTLEAAAAQMK